MPEISIDDLVGKYAGEPQERDIESVLAGLGAAPQNNLSWGDVPGKALANLPGSALQMGKGVYQAVTHPIETVGNVMDVAAGALRNITPKSIADAIDKIDANPKAAQRASSAADQLAAMYKQRYGSAEGFKQALANDPAGVIADAATVLAPIEGAAKLRSEEHTSELQSH